jgi:hypothetical protein
MNGKRKIATNKPLKPINTFVAQAQVLEYVMAFANLSIILSKNVAPPSFY